jgi:uncharacterized damage-inducible protein DinB
LADNAPMTNPILVNLFRHHRWANEQMLLACLPLTAEQLATEIPGTFGRLDRTLRHLARAEGAYLERLSGWTAPAGYELAQGRTDFPGVRWLIERMRLTSDALIDVARSIRPEATVVDEDGRAFPTWVVLLQAAYHATEHRQQIATILTNLGVEPPEPDLWAFQEARERGEVEAEPGSA